jgi:hypothetical protein
MGPLALARLLVRGKGQLGEGGESAAELACGARFAACDEMPNLVTRLCELGARGGKVGQFRFNR